MRRVCMLLVFAVMAASCASTGTGAVEQRSADDAPRAPLTEAPATDEKAAADDQETTDTEAIPGGIRVRDIDNGLAIFFLAQALGKQVLMVHGADSALVSGNWDVKDADGALRELAAASSLIVQRVTRPANPEMESETGELLVISPVKAGVDEVSLDGPFESDQFLTVELFAAKLENVLKLLPKTTDVETMEHDGIKGRVTTHLRTMPAAGMFNILVGLSGMSVEEQADAWTLSGSSLPAGDEDFESSSVLCEYDDANFRFKLDVEHEQLRLAGVVIGERPHALLMTADGRACVFAKGDQFVHTRGPDGETWTLDVVEPDRVVLVSDQGAGRVVRTLE